MLHVIVDVLGWPLTRIITADVWATDTIPADLPPMVEFKAKADAIIKERWGIEVEHVTRKTYEHYFYKARKSGKSIGQIHGFPMTKGAWCNDRLKTSILDFAKGKDCISYLGITVDEPERIEKHVNKPYVKLPLVEVRWTGAMCHQWCKDNGLLSPIYTDSARGGCWFCHNQGVDQLRLLRRNYPDYWALMLKWDADSPVNFHPDGHTVHDYDRRFELEDRGLVPADRRFRWEMLWEVGILLGPPREEEKEVHMSIEEIIKTLEESIRQNQVMLTDPVLFFGNLGAEVGIKDTKHRVEVLTDAIALLRTHPEAQPNEPLTLEELRKMDGQPVWVKDLHYSDYSGWWIIGWPPNGYCVLASAMRAHMGYSVENYGINWLAYRRP